MQKIVNVREMGAINSTTNYGLFQSIIGNRTVAPRPELKKSIEQDGLINPIIVDKSFRVLDGQHRLQCCIELGIPVEYIVRDIEERTIITLNTNQKRWNFEDYLEHHSANGNPNYTKLKQLLAQYALGTRNTLLVLQGFRTHIEPFSKGLFVVTEAQEQAFHKKVALIFEIFESSGGMFRKTFSQSRMFGALCRLMNSTNYQHERFIDLLNNKVALHQMKVLSRVEDNYILLCEIHDRGLHKNKILRSAPEDMAVN